MEQAGQSLSCDMWWPAKVKLILAPFYYIQHFHRNLCYKKACSYTQVALTVTLRMSDMFRVVALVLCCACSYVVMINDVSFGSP